MAKSAAVLLANLCWMAAKQCGNQPVLCCDSSALPHVTYASHPAVMVEMEQYMSEVLLRDLWQEDGSHAGDGLELDSASAELLELVHATRSTPATSNEELLAPLRSCVPFTQAVLVFAAMWLSMKFWSASLQRELAEVCAAMRSDAEVGTETTTVQAAACHPYYYDSWAETDAVVGCVVSAVERLEMSMLRCCGYTIPIVA